MPSRTTIDKQDLYKISELARATGVSTGTIKFYIREGLLPQPSLKTGRNMAYYHRSFIDRIRTIKELQRKRFLPLDVIKAILDRNSEVISQSEVDMLLGLEGTLYEEVHCTPNQEPLTRAEIEERFGIDSADLQLAVDAGVLNSVIKNGGEYFEGDDLSIVENFAALRQAGLGDLIDRRTTLPVYVNILDKLVREELKMFTHAVTGKVDEAELAEMAMAAVKLSERFIVLLRRKLLLQAIHELREGTNEESTGTGN